MSAPRSIATPVAASTRTRHLVAGPHRQGRVLGVFPSAVYLEFATRGVLELLAVETADGLRLPCAATLGAASSARPLTAVRAGDDARAGECHIDVGPLVFDVVRWWTPRRPRSVTPAAYDDARLALVSRLLPALPPDIGERLAALTTALAAARADDVAGAATALLGLGDGLTPLGDDVLAGLLVTFAATPPAEATHATEPLARLLADAVADEAPTRTTTLSAALLRNAADGSRCPLSSTSSTRFTASPDRAAVSPMKRSPTSSGGCSPSATRPARGSPTALSPPPAFRGNDQPQARPRPRSP